ncbi:MAG: beta-glucosidase BglX [Saprospiraceae bacterium]|nr:beta-glucosidase BglX [Saprospiraceae bacterium]
MKKISAFLIVVFLATSFYQCKTSKESLISSPKTLPFSSRVSALLGKMTTEEKIGQLNLVTPGGAVTGSVVSTDVEAKIKAGNVGGIFGIRGADKVRQAQQIAVEQSRLGIPLLVGMDVIHGHQTMFPIPLGLSCSWDPALIEQTARVAAVEATADGLMWAFSPMVDIARDPRWGRISEGSGEDPFLGSLIARAMVKGYQGNDLAAKNTLAACVKHYALYGAAEGGRDYATVDMSRIKMHNEYLPPYKAAIDAGVVSVMTSFNTSENVPATANQYLYHDVLRNWWAFNGLVVTDYTAINEMMAHGLGDLETVSALALKNTVDMDMVGEGFLTTLKNSLDKGVITMKDIDLACGRVLTIKEQLGILDDPYKYCDESRQEEIMSQEHRDFARKVAAESFVLLKNDKNVLPLKKGSSIAVVGPLANSRRNMLGTWSVSGDFEKAVTVLEGFREVAAGTGTSISYAKGANISDDPVFAKKVNAFGEEITIDKRSPEDMISEAVGLAKNADVVVAVMGEAADMTGEASSMADIGLQPSQVKLLEALKEVGKPIVLVLYNGRPMTLKWENEQIDAILDVWFGGTEGGRAVADVLFGSVNPSGRLTTSFPVHVGQIPVYHSMLNTGRPYRGEEASKFKSNYLDIPNEALFPFGFGLSYTSFEYGDVVLSAPSMAKGGNIKCAVTVKNTGNLEGREVVQLYIQDVAASISRPVKELKGFQKISLKPGESKRIEFTIDESLLSFYNTDLKLVSEPGAFKAMVGPNSRDLKEKAFELK